MEFFCHNQNICFIKIGIPSKKTHLDSKDIFMFDKLVIKIFINSQILQY